MWPDSRSCQWCNVCVWVHTPAISAWQICLVPQRMWIMCLQLSSNVSSCSCLDWMWYLEQDTRVKPSSLFSRMSCSSVLSSLSFQIFPCLSWTCCRCCCVGSRLMDHGPSWSRPTLCWHSRNQLLTFKRWDEENADEEADFFSHKQTTCNIYTSTIHLTEILRLSDSDVLHCVTQFQAFL